MIEQLSEHRIRRLAADYLGSQLQQYDDLIDAVLETAGDVDDRDEADALVEHAILDSGEFTEVDDRMGHLPSLLDGTRWVCAVSDDAASSGLLALTQLPFLGFLALARPLALHDEHGTTIGEITLVETDVDDDGEIDHLAGPTGWLSDAADRFAMFTFGPDATVRVTAIDAAPPTGPRLAAAFDDAFVAECADESFESVTVRRDDRDVELEFAVVDAVVTRMVAVAPDVLRDVVVPPILEVAHDGGFEVARHLVARAGFDWDALHGWQATSNLAAIWRLEPEVAELLHLALSESLVVADTVDDRTETSEEGDLRDAMMSAFGIALEMPGAAEAFWGEHQRQGVAPERTLDFVTQIVERGDDGAFGGARWVMARGLDHLGRPAEAEAVLRASVGGETPDHPRAMEMLAGFLSDRGDAVGAIEMLKRGDIFEVDDPEELDDVPLLVEIAGFAASRPKVAVGRNELCPCGSGKKYKKCHLGSERHPLHDRANWLFNKMGRYVRDNRFAGPADELLDAVTEASGRGWRFREIIAEAQWLTDLALWGSGAGEAFASERSDLLPDDEALLAAAWLLVEPGVFEVRGVGDDTLDLTNLRNGDQVTVSNLTPNDNTRRGTVLYGRPLPVGDTWRAMSGFVGVASNQVDAMIAAIDRALGGEPLELAHRIGASFARPVLTNTSGEPTRFHTLTWSADGVDADALTTAGFCDDGDGRFSLLSDPSAAGAGATVLASLRLADGTLTVECNSDERADAVAALLLGHFPDVRLLDHDYFETEELMRRSAAGEDVPSLMAADETDPETREILIAKVAELESEWLDMSIPALDDRTPRECAADPVAREKLVRLLAGFPETEELTRMSPARLRNALGL